MLILRGPLAYSHFRKERLLTQINYVVPQVKALQAEFVHFVDLADVLTPRETSTLSVLLRYGIVPRDEGSNASFSENEILKTLWVVPTLGSQSAWSLKASNLAKYCGLNKIRRIERGVVYSISSTNKVTWGDESAIARLLYDPLRETVFYEPEGLEGLFATDLVQPPMVIHTERTLGMAQGMTLIEADRTGCFFIDPKTRAYRYNFSATELILKADIFSSNLPDNLATALRHEVVTGRGAKFKAIVGGFSVAALEIPGFLQPWESRSQDSRNTWERVENLLDLALDHATFNNELGRPNVGGYCRTFGSVLPHQPSVLVAGLSSRSQLRIPISNFAVGTLSVAIGESTVKRQNPEMLRRCQEVINTCVALGIDNPVMRIETREERYCITLKPGSLDVFSKISDREACPFEILMPTVSGLSNAVLTKPFLTGSEHQFEGLPCLDLEAIDMHEALFRLLRFPAISDKSFLITMMDRTVTGLVARDPMVGPWQVPVSDCAVTTRGFDTYQGEAIAIGERGIPDPVKSLKIAIGEAITNIGAANIGALSDVRLSIQWRETERFETDAPLHSETLKTVVEDLCTLFGIGAPIDLNWPLASDLVSAVVTALAPVMDVRQTLTPLLAVDQGESALIFIDLSGDHQRLGHSALAQVFNQTGGSAPDLDDPKVLKAFFAVSRQLQLEGKILAYHDRSDGGLWITLCEMAFATHTGLQINISELGSNPKKILFNEELGVVIQIRRAEVESVLSEFIEAGVSRCFVIGNINKNDNISVKFKGEILCLYPRTVLQQAWSEMSFHLQSFRDNPRCAKKQYEAIADREDPGLQTILTFDPSKDLSAPFLNLGARPRVAILREQGTHGHLEMAAAFDRAQFDCVDVQMNDFQPGTNPLATCQGLAVCGGFSFGDVLGAGLGWAKRILLTPRLSDQFSEFFNRLDTFTLGIANGCQMLSGLKSIIPGAKPWPNFIRNYSEQFEARLCLVEIQKSNSLFLKEMEGSSLLVPVAHAEGRVEFSSDAGEEQAVKQNLVALRYQDNRGRKTNSYPANPDGSPFGITGLTTPDGRVLIMMPHPERAFRTVQYSWHPKSWEEEAPWLRLFQNARMWVG